MLDLQDILGASLPDTLLIVDRNGMVCEACTGTDGPLFDRSPRGYRLADLWSDEANAIALRETRKVLKSRRGQTAWVRLTATSGEEQDWELRFRVHGRERVLVAARLGSSISAATSGDAPLAHDSPDHDTTTGLRTYRWLLRHAVDLFNEAKLREDSVALAVIEFPSLDTIKASFGPDAGARIMRSAAERIQGRTRRRRGAQGRDEVALLARDALALLIPGVQSQEDLNPLIQRINDALLSPYAIDGREFAVASAMGVSLFPRDGNTPEALLQNARAALIDRTAQMKRPVFFSDTMPARSLAQLDVQEELSLAIERRQLSVRFSPIADARSGKVIALDVHPVLESPLRGEIGTTRLVSFAETTGLSHLLLHQMTDHALERVPGLLGNEALQGAAIRLNVQLGQLDEQLPFHLTRRCEAHGISPTQICITAPERAVMRGDTAQTLVALANRGFQVMLREFGAERIRLTDLAAQRFRGVQLASSLVQQLRSDAGQCMCRAIAEFVHALDMKLGAGNVDDSDEVGRLLSYGCDEFAGPLLGESLTQEALTALLQFQRGQDTGQLGSTLS